LEKGLRIVRKRACHVMKLVYGDNMCGRGKSRRIGLPHHCKWSSTTYNCIWMACALSMTTEILNDCYAIIVVRAVMDKDHTRVRGMPPEFAAETPLRPCKIPEQGDVYALHSQQADHCYEDCK
jgi:hypothetical protein